MESRYRSIESAALIASQVYGIRELLRMFWGLTCPSLADEQLQVGMSFPHSNMYFRPCCLPEPFLLLLFHPLLASSLKCFAHLSP